MHVQLAGPRVNQDHQSWRDSVYVTARYPDRYQEIHVLLRHEMGQGLNPNDWTSRIRSNIVD